MSITIEQLLGVFAAYNGQIWPFQWIAYLLGLVGLVLAIRPTSGSGRLIPALLAFFWLWVALLFWLPSGSQGFVPGFALAAVFLAQGLFFLGQVWRSGLTFGWQANLASWAGVALALYAMVGYPAAGLLVNHIYPQSPPFALAPCPLVTYTLGLLLLTQSRVPKSLLIVPLLYAISGIYWATVGMVEDLGMVIGGLVGIWLIWTRDFRPVATQSAEPPISPPDAGWSLDIRDDP